MKIDERIAKSIAIMFAAFGQGSDAERMAIYVEMLKDIPADILEKACKKSTLECRYLPTISEIVESAQNLVAEENGTNELPFAEVWGEILAELKNTYIWDKPNFSRKEITQLVNSFGWEELRYMKTDEVPIIRSQLRNMYDGICKRNREKNANLYVNGEKKLIEENKRLLK